MADEIDQPVGYQREGSQVRCGTTSGFAGHQRHDEKPCDACSAAEYGPID